MRSSIYQYDVEAGDLTKWSKQYSDALPEFFLQQKGVIHSISFNPTRPKVLFLMFHAIMIKIDLSQPVTSEAFRDLAAATKRKRDGATHSHKNQPRNFHLITQYAPILFARFVAGSELVVVQRPRAQMLKDLPAPAFNPKTF